MFFLTILIEYILVFCATFLLTPSPPPPVGMYIEWFCSVLSVYTAKCLITKKIKMCSACYELTNQGSEN